MRTFLVGGDDYIVAMSGVRLSDLTGPLLRDAAAALDLSFSHIGLSAFLLPRLLYCMIRREGRLTMETRPALLSRFSGCLRGLKLEIGGSLKR